MRATGIVRRIDELGRVVIPKEIRRTLRIREGDPLEIFTDHDGEVVLKKYSPIGEIATIAKDYTDSLYRTLGHVALISDRDAIVSSSGAAKREYVEKQLSAMGFELTESAANFLFMKHPEVDGGRIYEEMKNRGVLIRHFTKERICRYNRITIGTKEQMQILIDTIKDIQKEWGL